MAKTRKAAPQADDIESTCLVKGREKFVITYRPSRIPDAIRVLERWAADPELSMTPFDAAVFACQLRKGASPGGIQDADAAFEALCEAMEACEGQPDLAPDARIGVQGTPQQDAAGQVFDWRFGAAWGLVIATCLLWLWAIVLTARYWWRQASSWWLTLGLCVAVTAMTWRVW